MSDSSDSMMPSNLIIQDKQFDLHGVHVLRLQQDVFPISEYLSLICSLAPSIIAVIALAVWVIQPLLRLRPKWMIPFVKELYEQSEDFQTDRKKQYTRSKIALMILIPLGLASQVVASLYPASSVRALLAVLPWV